MPAAPRAGEREGKVFRGGSIVGASDPALIRVFQGRHRVVGNRISPAMRGVPAGMERSVPVFSNGDLARALVADVPFGVRESEAPGGHAPAAQGLSEIIGRFSAVRKQQRRDFVAALGSHPSERHRLRAALAGQKLIDDRAVAGVSDSLDDRLGAFDVDRLGDLTGGLPPAVVQESSRVLGVGLLLVEVSLRADVVGQTPGDFSVPAHAYERHAYVRHPEGIE